MKSTWLNLVTFAVFFSLKSVLSGYEPADLAKSIILPKVDMGDATVVETFEFLEKRSKELDPAHNGVKFILRDLPEAAKHRRVTFTLFNVSVFDAANRIGQTGDVRVIPHQGAFLVQDLNKWRPPPPAGDERKIEGTYSKSGGFTGELLVLKNGRFRFLTWSDAAPTLKRDTGTYQRKGRRIILLGDKSDYIDSVVWAEYDGVPMLFDGGFAYRSFIEVGFLSSEKVWLLEGADLSKHPNLKRMIRD